jgi:hypothetical protein
MRRAALVAIALVVGMFLLLLGGSGGAPSARRDLPPAPLHVPASAPAPEAAAARPEGGTDERALPADPDNIASGHVTDAHDRPLAGIRLLAISCDDTALWDAERPCTAPWEDPPAPLAHTDEDGVFAFLGLARGEYRLAIDEEDWTLDQPFLFGTGATGLRVVAVAASSPAVRVRDLATRERVARFVVRYRWPLDSPEERVGEGDDGLFRVKLRTSGLPVPCRVEAEGYRDVSAFLSCAEQVTWLVRVEEPRLTLRVVFEDGSPCEEDAEVVLRHRGGQATLPAIRTGSGRYQVAVPPGSWTLDFRPEKSGLYGEPCTTDFELAEGELREISLKMARGGDIVVRHEAWDGKPWWVSVQRGYGAVRMQMADATLEIRHVQPGRYVLSVPADPVETADPEGAAATRWQREIEVTTGSRHELTIE